MQLAELSAEVLLVVAEHLNADSLLSMEQTCRQLRALLRDVVAARCKRECFTTYLYPTIATYRMLAPVPEVSVLHQCCAWSQWLVMCVSRPS